MRTIVEELPSNPLELPSALVPMLCGVPSAYKSALDTLLRTLEGSAPMERIDIAAEALAEKLICARLRVDAVFLPKPLHCDDVVAKPRMARAIAALRFALEKRGVLLLLPHKDPQGVKPPAIAAVTEHLMTWEAMREADPTKRVELWRKRWEHFAVEEDAVGGKHSPERALFACYLADDVPARVLLKRTAPDFLDAIDRERGGAPAVAWRRAVSDMERRPTA